MNLIILTPRDLIGDNLYSVADQRAEHVISVLKKHVGDVVAIGLFAGPVGEAKITRVENGAVCLLTEKLSNLPPLLPSVQLICALPRPMTLKKILKLAAEMGVAKAHFVNSHRTEKSYFLSPWLDETKYMPLIVEGLSQGKHTQPLEITFHHRFRPFFEDELQQKILPALREPLLLLPDPDSKTALGAIYDGSAGPLVIAIGPEGGWIPFEIELMRSIGFQPFCLSRSILRVEHAVCATLSQVEMARLGRLT